MGHQPNRELEQELQKLRKPLEKWRRQNGAPKRIPEEIWVKATELACRHGVGAVAAGLRLDYSKLKGKVADASSSRTDKEAMTVATPGQPPSAEANFVEIFGATSMPMTASTTCVLQVESYRGSRLRMEVGGLDAPGLALLLREFA